MTKEQYGRIESDGVLKIVIPPKLPDNVVDKVVQFAPIPEFDQLNQAVYQSSPIDRGDYIDAGVEIREVKQDDVVEIELLVKEPISKG